MQPLLCSEDLALGLLSCLLAFLPATGEPRVHLFLLFFFLLQKFLGALDAGDVLSYFGTSSVADGMQGCVPRFRARLALGFYPCVAGSAENTD